MTFNILNRLIARALPSAYALLILTVLVLGLGGFANPTLALAEYIPPGEVVVRTESYTPLFNGHAEGEYAYSVSWQGIPVASAKIIVKGQEISETKFLHVETVTKTAKGIDIFYKLRHKSESVFQSDTIRPLRFYTTQTENSRQRARQVDFSKSGKIVAKTWKNGKPDEQMEFLSDNPTFDPISAAFLAKNLSLKVGEHLDFDVFNGKHRFLISFRVLKEEEISTENGRRKAFKVQPFVTKLTEPKDNSKFKRAYLWISADNNRDILKLESEVWIGSVKANLIGFTPASPTPLPVRLAEVLENGRAQLAPDKKAQSLD